MAVQFFHIWRFYCILVKAHLSRKCLPRKNMSRHPDASPHTLPQAVRTSPWGLRDQRLSKGGQYQPLGTSCVVTYMFSTCMSTVTGHTHIPYMPI